VNARRALWLWRGVGHYGVGDSKKGPTDKAMARGKSGVVGLAALLLLASAAPNSATWAAEKADRPTPSGLPVPRYVSLKFDTVNARSAPGDDSRLLWVYHQRGLPVQVVAETPEWRRICDPEGGLAWVHRRTTDGKRMVMRLKPEPLAMRAKADAKSRIVAYLAPRALADLDRCDKDGWCKLKVGRAKGWAPADQVWGADDEPHCR
jgi:SH3-like domain-containing protein